jgi:hypothetical protein
MLKLAFSSAAIAVGVVMVLAISATAAGISLTALGWVLIAIGALGLVAAAITSRRAPPSEPPS